MTICVLCRNDTTILRKDEKQAYYNFLNTSIPNCIACNIDLSKPRICGIHRKKLIEDKETTYTEENIVDVVHPKCKTDGCDKQPNFNFPGEKKGAYCSKCANKYNAAHPNKADMIDVIHSRCKTPGCHTQPNFNLPGQKKGLYCASCAIKYNKENPDKTNMENVISSKCKTPGCDIQPNFNFPGETRGLYCGSCANKYNVEHPDEVDMIDVVHSKCKTVGCDTRPSFNLPGQKKGLYCASCADKYNEAHPNEADMIDVENPKCKTPGCNTQPNFNFPGETVGIYCAKCVDLTKMKDVVNKYCSSCGLTRIVPSTNAYGGLCIECAQHKGIAKRPRNVRVQEKAVAEYLKKHFKNISLSEDTPLEGSCVNLRPDISCDFGNFILIVEIDENQHKGKAYTSCDTKRNVQLLINGGSRPIVFIRFNPDNYKKNGNVIPACFQKNTNGKLQLVHEEDWNVRLDKLRQEIENVMIQNDCKDVEDLKEMTYVHLYFDE